MMIYDPVTFQEAARAGVRGDIAVWCALAVAFAFGALLAFALGRSAQAFSHDALYGMACAFLLVSMLCAIAALDHYVSFDYYTVRYVRQLERGR